MSPASRVRPERYGVQPLALPKLVQGVQVGVDVVGVIRKRRIVGHVPLLRRSHVLRRPSLGFGLVVHHVESDDELQKVVQRRVRRGVDGDLEEGLEDVVEHLLEVLHRALAAVDVVQARSWMSQTTLLLKIRLLRTHDASVSHSRRGGRRWICGTRPSDTSPPSRSEMTSFVTSARNRPSDQVILLDENLAKP